MIAATRRATPADLVGRDFAPARASSARRRTRPLAWLLATGFTCALALAALRIDILRVRYALGEALREEKALVQQQRLQTAALESLRHPARLVQLAHRRGFAPPERVIDLRSEARASRSERKPQVSRSEPKASEDQQQVSRSEPKASEDQQLDATTR